MKSLIAILILLSSPLAFPCSSVVSPSSWSPAFGHNDDMDSNIETAMGGLTLNKRGLHKRGLAFGSTGKAAEWKSLYASLAFSNMGPEYPFSGLNEKGLYMVFHHLPETRFPDDQDLRPVLNVAQYVQYHLDRAATLQDVIRGTAEVRPFSSQYTVHFLACDATRACLVLEYINGSLLTYQGKDLPYPVMTNDQVPVSAKAAKSCEKSGCQIQNDSPWKSLSRYAELVSLWKNAPASSQPVHKSLWRWLDQVRQQPGSPWTTRFQVVYDLATQQVYAKHWRAQNIMKVHYDFKSGLDCTKDNLNNHLYVPIKEDSQGDRTADFHSPSRDELVELARKNGMPQNRAEMLADLTMSAYCE